MATQLEKIIINIAAQQTINAFGKQSLQFGSIKINGKKFETLKKARPDAKRCFYRLKNDLVTAFTKNGFTVV